MMSKDATIACAGDVVPAKAGKEQPPCIIWKGVAQNDSLQQVVLTKG
jgi:hypothetical protein